jgi:hypothetical protein
MRVASHGCGITFCFDQFNDNFTLNIGSLTPGNPFASTIKQMHGVKIFRLSGTHMGHLNSFFSCGSLRGCTQKRFEIQRTAWWVVRVLSTGQEISASQIDGGPVIKSTRIFVNCVVIFFVLLGGHAGRYLTSFLVGLLDRFRVTFCANL